MEICFFVVSRAQLQALRMSLGHEQHADRQVLQPLFSIVGGVIDAYDAAFGQPAAPTPLAPPAADAAASTVGDYGGGGGNAGAGAGAVSQPVGFVFGGSTNRLGARARSPGLVFGAVPGARAMTLPPAVAAVFGNADNIGDDAAD